MAESTADATAGHADTLRLELKKTMTEILDDGGVSEDRGETDGSPAVLRAIDEAVKILNCLREVESKKPESDISSSSTALAPEVPKEFKCMLSRAVMSEPVVIASGQTYERRYITQWLTYKQTCPKTKEALSHRWVTPNHLIDELITQWYRVNKYERPKPSQVSIGLFSDDIDSLLQRMCSPSSVEEQNQCANELRRQTKWFANVTAFFIDEIPDSINRLLSPLTALGETVDSDPALQKNIITSLLYISRVEENKTVVAQNPLVIPLLTKSLKQGTAKTRRNSAEALWSLSTTDSNMIIIGNSEALKALIDVIKEGDSSTARNAAYAVYHLCFLLENREKAVSEGLFPVLINKIKGGCHVQRQSHVYIYLAVLSLLSTHNGVTEAMEDPGFIDELFSILRNPSFSETCEKAVAIVLCMCRNRESTMKLVEEEEDKFETFTKLAEQGSDHAVTKAEAVLRLIKRSGTGEEPQRG